jgi:MoxR-like ATPase
MIAERLAEAHHVAARFNHGAYSDADEMFGALADAVLDAIEDQSDEIKKSARRGEKIAKALQKSAKAAGEATKHAGDIGVPGARVARGVIATGGYVSGVLRRVFEKKKIAQLNEALGALPQQARCVVLIDDIDRAEPSLLPPLLFALHEVLIAMPNHVCDRPGPDRHRGSAQDASSWLRRWSGLLGEDDPVSAMATRRHR